MENPTFKNCYYLSGFNAATLTLICFEALKEKEIYARRYFYPSLASVLHYVESKKMPVTEDISRRVLCLPLYHELSNEEVDLICRLILRVQNN